MVNVETAVKIALDQLGKVMPEYLALSPSLEEIELSQDGSLWNVTFRAKNPDAENDKAHVYFPYRDKVAQITVSDGHLIAIRNPSYN